MVRLLCALGVLALAACSKEADAPSTATPTAPAGGVSPVASAPVTNARTARYTALTDCKMVREDLAEMPYIETLCPGPGGWALRIGDADARQSMTVVAPDGREALLALTGVGGGGFSAFGDRAEWRGANSPFVPDSLIVRFNIAEQQAPAPETSYLVVARLIPNPCVTAIVPAGADQSDSARTAADDPAADSLGACKTG